MTKHYRGKAITIGERAQYSYLQNKLWYHTECGYLFDDTEKDRDRITRFKDEVTCKNCLKIMKQNGIVIHI